jgi:hypothetical protein
MFDDFEHATDQHNDDEAFGILQELEQSTPDEIRRQRAHFRIAIKTRLILQAGNASQLLDFKVQGVTGDISESGLGALFPIPLRVGDIYRLTFAPAADVRPLRTLPPRPGRFVRGRLPVFFTHHPARTSDRGRWMSQPEVAAAGRAMTHARFEDPQHEINRPIG